MKNFSYCDMFSEAIGLEKQLYNLKDCDCVSWGDMIVFSTLDKNGERQYYRMYKDQIKKFVKKCYKRKQQWIWKLIELTLEES